MVLLHTYRLVLAACLATSTWLDAVASGPASSLESLRRLYWNTQYEQVLKVLGARQSLSAEEYELAGRAYFMLGRFEEATLALEKAIALSPGSSTAHNWLGKAWGRRAEKATFLTAPSLAVKARGFFEKAVELDPANLEAASDLLEYYVAAPGFLGGGLDKAAALAARIKDLDPAEYQRMQARLAEKRKDYPAAEHYLREAARLAPKQIGRLLDLAQYLARRSRLVESDQTFHDAARIDPQSAALKFSRAKTYLETGRNQELALRLLREYLNSPLTADDPPKAEAEDLLRRHSGS